MTARAEQSKRLGWFWLVILCVHLTMLLTGCSATNEKNAENSAAVDATATEIKEAAETETKDVKPTEVPYELVDMKYLSLKVPAGLSEYLEHEQSTYGNAITESFYMKAEEENIPLFSIDVGDENMGTWLGMLKSENGNVPITYTVFTVTEEQLATLEDGAAETYAQQMDAFNQILDGIQSDERFTFEKPLAVGEDSEAQMTYWSLTLPVNMTVVETNENGTYIAMFNGEVAGERTALYTVHIGDDKAESELGLFEVDGVKKPISVGSFDLAEKPNWTEDDYSIAYRMMDTINHVIETIMNSEQFSVPTEELAAVQ